MVRCGSGWFLPEPGGRQYNGRRASVMSACPHVAMCVLPRQMVEDGNPGRRATDHSESFGASLKEGIHNRCKAGNHLNQLAS